MLYKFGDISIIPPSSCAISEENGYKSPTIVLAGARGEELFPTSLGLRILWLDDDPKAVRPVTFEIVIYA